MGKKCLNTIYSQFYKGKYMDKIVLIPISINQKKVTDLMENCPGLRDFFNSLEKRDKKYLISSSSIIEMSSKV